MGKINACLDATLVPDRVFKAKYARPYGRGQGEASD